MRPQRHSDPSGSTRRLAGGAILKSAIRNPQSAILARRARGAVLLEVIFAIALLAAACGTIIGGFNACTQANRSLWLESKAADLAVTLLSEMQMGGGSAVDEGPTDYLEPLQDWCWQVATTELDPRTEAGATMTQVRITITHKSGDCSYTLYYLTPSSSQTTTTGSSLASGGGLAGGGP